MDSNFGDGANNNIGWGLVYKCESGDCALATATLNSSAFLTIASGATTDIVLQDENSDPITPDSVVGSTITVTLGSTPVGAELLRTGQTTSYRTGDDGDIEAGRDTSFSVLATANPFGNTNRFTDELGGTTYTNNIVIDWSTYDGTQVLGYKRTLSGSAVTWNNAIDGALAVSIGSFTSGWRLPNAREMFNICKFEGNPSYLDLIDYAPFSISVELWTSTTLNTQSTFAWSFGRGSQGIIRYDGKSTTYKHIAVRNFIVTGTTLS